MNKEPPSVPVVDVSQHRQRGYHLFPSMLVILFLFSLMRTLGGSPLSPPYPISDDFPALDVRDASSHFGQRTVNDIIISCFATIFACTWTAIHPNISAPTDCWWTRFKRQVTTMFYALLLPELITIWALKQRMAAKEIMEEYNKEILGVVDDAQKGRNLWMAIIDAVKCIPARIHKLFYDMPLPEKSEKGPRWTMAHGFFLQMGGFMLADQGKPIYTLLDGTREQNFESKRLLSNIRRGITDPPRITDEDIRDRSKGDAISKAIIVLQTTWFIIQCITRWSQHLPVTELEIITLGFAALNGITYGLWWHKPQNVGRPVFLERNKKDPVPPEVNDSPNNARPMTSQRGELDAASLLQKSNATKESWLGRKIRQEIQNRRIWLLPFTIAYQLMHAFFRGFNKLLRSDGDGNLNEHRVPMFYSAGAAEGGKASLIGTLIIVPFFGSIHLIPSWFLDFSSLQETWLWRVSAITITVVPTCVGVLAIVDDSDKIPEIVFLFIGIGVFFYPAARIILLVLSLTALRSVPPEALQTIEWTTFLPHL